MKVDVDLKLATDLYEAWSVLYLLAGSDGLSGARRKMTARAADNAARALNEALDSPAPMADAVERFVP